MNYLVKPVWDISGKTVLVLGATGLVGSALLRRLKSEDCTKIGATRHEADLTLASETLALIQKIKPDAIFIAAAKVGGILANRDYAVQFLEENLLVQINILRAAHQANVERVIFLGSSCIYPKHAAQPISEKSLMTGPLEPTNDAYAIAKIAGIRLIDGYRKQYGRHWISAMPTNLYGPNDNFDLQSSHVIPALLRKFHEAILSNQPSVEIWGTGVARREFLHVDDCADALVHCAKTFDAPGPINIGYGREISIKALSEMIKAITGFTGELHYDFDKPDGMLLKLTDSSLLNNSGWNPKIDLKIGITSTYEWFLKNQT